MSHRILSLLRTHAVKLVGVVLLICAIFVGLPLLAGRNATEFSVCDYETLSFSDDAVAYTVPADWDERFSRDSWDILEGEASDILFSFFSDPMVTITQLNYHPFPTLKVGERHFFFCIIDGDVEYMLSCRDSRLYYPFRTSAMMQVLILYPEKYAFWYSPVSVNKLRALKDLYDSIIAQA